jgi:hypothetical protein
VLYFNVALSLPIVSKHTRNVFNFKRANLTMLQSKLNRLSECFNEDLDDISVWTSWSDDVLEISKQCIPKVRVRSSNDPPWFDSEARHLVNQKRTLWRKAKRVNTVNAWKRYKTLNNRVRSVLRGKHEFYIESLGRLCSANPKRFWSFFEPKPKVATYRSH